MATNLPDLILQLRNQRGRISALARKNARLQTNGKRLLAESTLLVQVFRRSRTELANTFRSIENAAETFRLRHSSRERGLGAPSNAVAVSERVLVDSPDTLEALRQAAEILQMEFADTEGSGRETLVKCASVLKRTQSVRTIELPLY